MALTLNDFCGFETGGLEELDNTSGSPDATEATVVRSGNRSLKLTAASFDTVTFQPFNRVADAGNDYIIGFGVQVTDKTPSVERRVMFLRESTSTILTVRLQTDGDLELQDAGNVARIDVADPFSVDTWHYIEVYFEHSGTGNCEIFIDGVSGGTGSGDFDSGGTFDSVRFDAMTDITTVYIDDYYILSGATASSDRLGDAEVFKYQSSKASATPDDGGGDLDAGDWDECGKTPLDATTPNAEYTDTGAGAVDSNSTNGSPEGPLNDSRIQGEIRGMKGISNMRRSGGGGTAHFILMGNSVDGATRSADIAPTTAFANYFFVSESASIVPTASEYCRIGFEMDNAQDYECQEQWAMLLHVPATIAELGIKPPMWDTRFRHMLVR